VLAQEQRKEIAAFTEQLGKQEFAKAAKTAEGILNRRERTQGTSHWETAKPFDIHPKTKS
jgi:hypothetical protein